MKDLTTKAIVYPLARSVMPLKRSCSPCHRDYVSEKCSRHCPELQKVSVEQVLEEASKALETSRIDAMLNPCKRIAQDDFSKSISIA